MKISDLILESAKASLALQRADGSFPPGHNGPYDDLETSVRNTAHWVITLCKAYDLSGENIYKDAAWRAAQYLLSTDARPMFATFFCRRNPEKDFSNGLIGQAWVIEALALVSDTLGNPLYSDLAEQVFLMHPFDDKIGLWKRVNVDGSYSTFDMTFNHQLWFAATGLMISDNVDDEVGRRIFMFLERVSTHLLINRSGRIKHFVKPISYCRHILRSAFRFLTNPILTLTENKNLRVKEIGYHAFNLYAFSLIKNMLPNHPIWQTQKISSVIRYLSRDEYIRGVENNYYSFQYNPIGIEVAFSILTFADPMEENVTRLAQEWIEKQLHYTFDLKSCLMQKNTNDPATLAARVYELTRIPDLSMDISI
mgnify:CR=1 FL=1